MSIVKGTLIFDIETHSADLLYTLPPEEFVRLIGYRWAGGETVLTTNLDEIRDQILQARFIIGHNIHHFDLPAVFGVKSDMPLQLARHGRVYDTFIHAGLVNPIPVRYTDRHGKERNTSLWNPELKLRWYGLDEQAHQLGVPGKTADLDELAKEFGGYGQIPVDDSRYLHYLSGDVQATDLVSRRLLELGTLNDYAQREQLIAAVAAVISANGLRVDKEAAQARVDYLAERREQILTELVASYGFPTKGRSPWASSAGKEAILKALADCSITEITRPDWPRTAKGQLSLGGGALIDLTQGTEAEELGRAVAELKGQRSLAQLALDSMHPDGFVHPSITMLQLSGRWSTTKPGLTVWTNRGDGAEEKAYFIPDTPDESLLEIDYSNADARAVAAMSGDRRYAERFEPGADGHEINAVAAWGREKYDSDPAYYRNLAKPGGHGWGYRIGAKKLAATWGLPVAEAKGFLAQMNAQFHRVVAWQDRAAAAAAQYGYVTGHWGRRMPVDPQRSWTQGPALLGQNVTREIVCDSLIGFPDRVLRTVKAQIHDALLVSVKTARFEECRDYLVQKMTTSFHPLQGQRIDFPVSAGPAARNWREAKHD